MLICTQSSPSCLFRDMSCFTIIFIHDPSVYRFSCRDALTLALTLTFVCRQSIVIAPYVYYFHSQNSSFLILLHRLPHFANTSFLIPLIFILRATETPRSKKNPYQSPSFRLISPLWANLPKNHSSHPHHRYQLLPTVLLQCTSLSHPHNHGHGRSLKRLLMT